jgi:guanosine-3',5'-bis(diphosphate) 3'-pyrophosphohydrolase
MAETTTHLWQHAAAFAARAHEHQHRKDGVTPYVSHCVRVALTLRHVFDCDDEVALTAAILHDTIEDTGADYDEIHEAFGPAVADCVAALTKNMTLPESEREPDYDRRLGQADWRARLVKLADVYDNLSDLSRPQKLPKMLDKCRRAIALAEPDASAHACVGHAIEHLGDLMRDRA